MKKLLLTLLTPFALAVSLHANPPTGWTDDYAKALEKAKAEKKNILLDFTGSDWCGFCVRLEQEVFDKAKFKTWARKNVVLVQVDFPKRKRQKDKLVAQNQELKKKFQKSGGYPTVVIINTEEKELARKAGYPPGSGPEAYIEALKAGEVATQTATKP